MKKQPKRITASDIRSAMAKRWMAPEWAIMWEVRQSTGSMAGRSADAVMMSLWPSRGLELHGVEIKVSRSDWKREAADPTKAEAIARYCDRWWVHTAPNVVDDLSDLPPAWGLREWNGQRWKTVREADKTEAEPISRAFLASMLRRADSLMREMIQEAAREGQESLQQEAERSRERFADEVQRAVERRTGEFERDRARIEAFEAAFGKSGFWPEEYARLGAAARALSDCGARGYGSLAKRLRKAADEIDAIVSMSEPALVSESETEALSP